jgi:hypothetical protein
MAFHPEHALSYIPVVGMPGMELSVDQSAAIRSDVLSLSEEIRRKRERVSCFHGYSCWLMRLILSAERFNQCVALTD